MRIPERRLPWLVVGLGAFLLAWLVVSWLNLRRFEALTLEWGRGEPLPVGEAVHDTRWLADHAPPGYVLLRAVHTAAGDLVVIYAPEPTGRAP